jgi:hypothetical protein
MCESCEDERQRQKDECEGDKIQTATDQTGLVIYPL